MSENTNLVLISGKSATGKTTSLKDMRNPEGIIYANCENNKRITFKSKFTQFTVTDPYQIYQIFEEVEGMPDKHTIIIDTLTYMMDMFETMYVLNAANSMKMWGEYAQFFKKLMAQHVASSTKNVIFLAHSSDVMNDSEMAIETLVKVKGSLMNTGIESFFSTVIGSKKLPLKALKGYESKLLDITAEDEALGYKYVYQTKLTKDTVYERIRSPIGMWDTKETYIDNNIQHVIDRLHEYYGN